MTCHNTSYGQTRGGSRGGVCGVATPPKHYELKYFYLNFDLYNHLCMWFMNIINSAHMGWATDHSTFSNHFPAGAGATFKQQQQKCLAIGREHPAHS